MPNTDDMALWHALNRLLADYWDEVDRNAGQRAHEFYLPDALYTVGENAPASLLIDPKRL